MPTTYTGLLGLALPATGELSGTWGATVNSYISEYLDSAVAGVQTISGTQTAVTLSVTNGASLVQAGGAGATGSAQYMVINCTGTPASLLTISAPNASKVYVIINGTAQSVKLVGVTGPTTGVTMVTGEKAVCAWNGSDFVKVATSVADGVTSVAMTVPSLLSVSGSPITSSGTLALTYSGTALPVANGGTGTTSTTFVNLATNVTGTLPVGNGGTGITSFGSGIATFLGTPSSANLAAALTDETGSGSAVFATSPTLVTPILGTPQSATLTNATGLPLSSGVTGILPVANGGTATATPSLVQGSGVTITGTWPNQTINATGSGGSVTSVSGTGTVNGISLSGTVTTSGSLTLGGTLSGVSLTTQVTGTLPIANGGTGTTSTTFANLTTNVTGTLPVANGGTGQTTLAAANIAVVNVANTFTGTQTFSGTSSAQAIVLNDAAEVATVSATAATGTINYDITTQSVLYYTSNASANWTVNFRGSSGTSLNTLMSTGQSMTVAFLVTQGSTAYYNNVVQVDGSTVTPKYQGGTAYAAGNASSVDVYMYTIIKTGNAAFTVFTSQTKFA